MVASDLSFEIIKSKKKFFCRRLSDRVGWSSGGPSLNGLRNYRWLRTMNTEPFDILRNYEWLCIMNTEPFDVLRNY